MKLRVSASILQKAEIRVAAAEGPRAPQFVLGKVPGPQGGPRYFFLEQILRRRARPKRFNPLKKLNSGGEHDAGERRILTEAKKKFVSTVFRLRARGAGLQRGFSLAERGVGAKFLVWRPPGSEYVVSKMASDHCESERGPGLPLRLGIAGARAGIPVEMSLQKNASFARRLCSKHAKALTFRQQKVQFRVHSFISRQPAALAREGIPQLSCIESAWHPPPCAKFLVWRNYIFSKY